MTGAEALYSISPTGDSTIAADIFEFSMGKRKDRIFFFEEFGGELRYNPDSLERSRLALTIDPAAVRCGDKRLRPKKRDRMTGRAREILAATGNGQIRFDSTQISAKALRGLTIEGALTIGNKTKNVKLNLVLSVKSNDRVQMDGDATFRLSEFGITPPSRLFGLVRTKDEVLVRFLLWAARKASGEFVAAQ